ncbi:hypothetical protein DPMN_160309 [Dreissena polymorpha]|uniref:Uncharacterized protein n=1 Tax=Dreissena polymorpha TaxID=45954 RepID=A0A9D4EKJ9_DREPO|nr:hypothetical protein DPMN_160309 [Dreissena polymorpha]
MVIVSRKKHGFTTSPKEGRVQMNWQRRGRAWQRYRDSEVMAYEDNASVEGRRSMCCGNRSRVRVDSLWRLEAIQSAASEEPE